MKKHSKAPTIAILTSTDPHSDPRVYRQIIALQDEFRLTIISNLSKPHPDFRKTIQYVNILEKKDHEESTAVPGTRLRGKLIFLKTSKNQLIKGIFFAARTLYRLFRAFDLRITNMSSNRIIKSFLAKPENLRLKEIFSTITCDLVLVNDIDCLPAAVEYSKCRVIVFDAHEFSLGEAEENFWWRIETRPIVQALCNRYLPRIKVMTTVCEGIKQEYLQLYPHLQISVLTNAAPYANLKPTAGRFPIRVIHHGIAEPARNLHSILHAFDLLPDKERYTLDLMLIARNQAYFQDLVAQAERINKTAGYNQISFPAPVPMNQIVQKIHAYDIQIIMTPPVNLNNKYSLPNKFFEAIQARNALLIGPMPEMQRIVTQFEIGIVAKSFTPADISMALQTVTLEKLAKFKSNSSRAANILNADENAKRLRDLVYRTLETSDLATV